MNTGLANKRSLLSYAPAKASGSVQLLQQRLVQFSFFNLFIVSGIGLLLRYFPFLSSFPLAYKNILHGHSHFAFGGWVMPILVALLIKKFPDIANRISFKHWRNISVLLLVSAYGMLLSFPVEGYKAVSITFSTLSVIAGYYLAIVIWKAAPNDSSIAIRFLKAGLIYLTIASIGPFATGPLIALHKGGTPIYFDAIYFYLHFEYNGWFTFAILALLYKMLEQKGVATNGKMAFTFFNLACFPAYFLSVLWHQPSLIFNIIGGIAGLLQLAGLFFLLKDVRLIGWKKNGTGLLFTISIASFVLKNLLQFLGTFPSIALMAYYNRNFVIAYLHLVLLGFVSLFVFASLFQAAQFKIGKTIKLAFGFFLLALITTELLLAGFAMGTLLNFSIPSYAIWLLVLSCFFPISFFLLSINISKQVNSKIINLI